MAAHSADQANLNAGARIRQQQRKSLSFGFSSAAGKVGLVVIGLSWRLGRGFLSCLTKGFLPPL